MQARLYRKTLWKVRKRISLPVPYPYGYELSCTTLLGLFATMTVVLYGAIFSNMPNVFKIKINYTLISTISLSGFFSRCAPGYQGNPLLPNGKCVPVCEYTYIKEIQIPLHYCLACWTSQLSSRMITRRSKSCAMIPISFSLLGFQWIVVCGHGLGMQGGWNPPRWTFFSICDLSTALSLQQTHLPSVMREELSAPAAGHAAVRYGCSMVNI